MSESKVVLITGASSGIGQAIARTLARERFTVFGTSRNPPAVEPVPGVEVLPLDVRQDGSVNACLDAVLSRAGRLDVLVNNAGYVLTGAIEDASVEDAEAQFETNFFGVVRMVKAVLPGMRQRRSGQIVNISSLAGLVPAPPFCGMYSASKHALEAYTEHLWREVRPFQIRVSLVEPGSIKPTLVAERVLDIIRRESPKLRYRVGTDATWVPRLRQVLPAGRFERGIRRIFQMDAES
jgi:NAD(P)-dependent dehydrogenase (short-subunit alcohol dehydrogenase family)